MRPRFFIASAVALMFVALTVPVFADGDKPGPPKSACRFVARPVLDATVSGTTPLPARQVEEDIDEVVAYADRHRDTFAGSYLEAASKHLRYFSVVFTTDIAAHAEALRQVVDHPEALRFYLGTATRDELEALQKRFGQELVWPDPDPGPNVEATGISEQKNAVYVQLHNYSRRVANRLQRRYGPHLCVEVGSFNVEPVG